MTPEMEYHAIHFVALSHVVSYPLEVKGAVVHHIKKLVNVI